MFQYCFKWWSIAFYLFVDLFLFLFTILNVLNNMDYTITYFLPVPSIEHRTRARSELLNTSLVSPRAKFYTALSVSFVGSYVTLVYWILDSIGVMVLKRLLVITLVVKPNDFYFRRRNMMECKYMFHFNTKTTKNQQNTR